MERTSRLPFWFREPVGGGLEIRYLCEKAVYTGKSIHQQIDIVDTQLHGRMLFLDGVAQSSESDEFIYHEMLVHPAIFSHPRPRSVLVIGGATGATLREVFRHSVVRRVVLVDIDGELIEVCKRYMPTWHQGSFKDPRLEIRVQDGREYVENCSEMFDVIILDLSDPLVGTPAPPLYTREFYQSVRRLLSPRGCLTMQAEGVSPQQFSLHAKIINTLKHVFPVVRPYTYTLHSFHRPDAHALATIDPEWSFETLFRRIDRTGFALDCFSPETIRGSFRLPPYLYRAYESSDEILADEQPADEQAALEKYN